MRISEIYETHPAGSDEFVAAAQAHCAYDISDDEIRRISGRAMSGNDRRNHVTRRRRDA